MTWWDYVKRCTTAPKAHIAQAIGITPSSVGRWEKGSNADPLQAAAFARAYGRPVLEAFIAAGFLTSSEAGEAPAAAPSLDALDDDELLAEVRRRMTGGISDDGKSEAQKSAPPGNVRPLNPRHQQMLEDAQEADWAAYEEKGEGDDRA